jgi:hypothetical protein
MIFKPALIGQASTCDLLWLFSHSWGIEFESGLDTNPPYLQALLHSTKD